MNNRRRRYWIDMPVQGALARRLVIHWLVFFALCTLLLPLWRLANTMELDSTFASLMGRAWQEIGPIFILMFLLLPLFVWDTVKLSNRFAGPMFRFRKAISALASGEPVDPIHLRRDDFWKDVADDFNVVLRRVKSLELAGAGSDSATPTTSDSAPVSAETSCQV